MEIDVKPGTYVLAVSGGVDSMVLLDLLAGQTNSLSPIAGGSGYKLSADGYRLIVAHFDHGIRGDSVEDRKLVQTVAKRYGLPFVYEEGKLGKSASEDEARKARYVFLERVKRDYHAQAIITAHHQDDMLETAILNLLRGTGRTGLAPLGNRPGILRPLLGFTKQDLRSYAREHHVQWREDSTNTDEQYLRNYVRRQIMPRLGNEARQELLKIIDNTRATNRLLDGSLRQILAAQTTSGQLGRAYFAQLPHDVAKELLAGWLRAHGIRDFTAQTLERVTVAAKTQQPGSTIDIMHHAAIRVSKDNLALVVHER